MPGRCTCRTLATCCLTLAALSACQQGAHPVTPPRSTTPPPVVKPANSAPPAAARALQKPPGNPRVLEGTIQLDAGYMASVSTGHALADAYAVADAAVVSNNGTNIISDNGGGIISDNGGGILSNNGGSLTSKVKFGLLADAAPALGQELPIAGMALAVMGLGDGQAIPLGVDPDGKPAYVVHTDAAGHYKVYLPEDRVGNVQVVAGVPDASDPRLRYAVVVDPKATGAERFNEESALVSDYMRFAIYQLLVSSLGDTNDSAGVKGRFQLVPPEVEPLLEAGLAPFLDVVRKQDDLRLSLAHRRRALHRFADALVARLDLAAIQTVPAYAPGVPAGPAIAALEAALREVDQAAAARMAGNPHYFDDKPYVLEANFHRATLGLPPVAIRRPSDVGRFTNEEYEGDVDPARRKSAWALAVDLGLPASKEDALTGIYSSLFLGMATQIFLNDALHDELVKQANDLFKAEAALPEPPAIAPATPPFPIPQEPAVTVGTLAGTGAVGFADGPAATATVGEVRGLALDGAGRLYFTQPNVGLRRVDPTAPGTPVTTVVGDLPQVDGLAMDPAAAVPTAYLGDFQQRRILKVELPDGKPPVLTTLAGSGGSGSDDGLGASATMVQPSALALDGHGGLVFTDQMADRVRRVDLVAPDHPVTTLVGAPRPDGLTPGSEKGALKAPRGVAVTPQGELLVTEWYENRLWSVGTAGLPHLLAGRSDNPGLGDGFFIGAGFFRPVGLAMDRDGSVLVADRDNERIRRVRLQAGAGVVTTVAGSGADNQPGFADGPGATARFASPWAIAVGPDGTIYVGEVGRIRTIKR